LEGALTVGAAADGFSSSSLHEEKRTNPPIMANTNKLVSFLIILIKRFG
jgi:hypothetical protein